MEAILEGITCPLLLCTMVEPVVGADGITYSKEGWDKWAKNRKEQFIWLMSPHNPTCPMAEALPKNYALINLIDALREALNSRDNAVMPAVAPETAVRAAVWTKEQEAGLRAIIRKDIIRKHGELHNRHLSIATSSDDDRARQYL